MNDATPGHEPDVAATQLLDWPEYVRRLTDGSTGSVISAMTGIPQPTISRWLSGKTRPNPKQALTVARAYRVHPLEALLAAGYIAEEDLDMPITPPRNDLEQFTALELALELRNRVAAAHGSE